MITLGQNDQAFLLSMNLTVYNMNKRKPQSLRGYACSKDGSVGLLCYGLLFY